MISVVLSLAAADTAVAQSAKAADDRYRMPPQALARLIDRQPTPSVSISPDNRWVLILDRPNLPDIAEMAQAELRLAGRRINPATNGPSRTRYLSGLRMMNVSTKKERRVTGLPRGARISWPMWSPDNRHIAFTVTNDSGIALFAADLASGKARQLT
ncbi:MAG: S9 family peptidase, partial [Myxococcota bacterium]